MNGEEFGLALLRTIEAKETENPVVMRLLASAVRRTLGIPEDNNNKPPEFHQPRTRPEFPQLRIKYDSSGNEITRRAVHSYAEFGQAVKENPEIVTWCPVPLDSQAGEG